LSKSKADFLMLADHSWWKKLLVVLFRRIGLANLSCCFSE
jgi:hypothetical protein